MITFTKPANLNGKELVEQLNAAGININTETSPFDDGQGNLLLDIAPADETKAEAIVAAHNGTVIAPEPTVADKLASVGLSVTDLKEALGI
jgi:hypothetical protein